MGKFIAEEINNSSGFFKEAKNLCFGANKDENTINGEMRFKKVMKYGNKRKNSFTNIRELTAFKELLSG